MLTKNQIEEIREHLEKAQNPVFYYDNDADGFCSFILLRRFIGRGYGVAIRSYPALNESYSRKAEQLKADYVFILDKPIIEEGFVKSINSMQIPIVWIDHHDEKDIFSKKYDNFFAYNPTKNKGKNKSNEPVAYLSYKIANKKEDLWISMMGCIADCFMPDFSKEFVNKYPSFWKKNIKHPFEALYETEIGNIAFALGFGLKDSVSNVIHMQNFLINIDNPQNVFAEVNANKNFRKRYSNVKKKFDEIIKKGEEIDNLIWLEYGGDISMSADIANKFIYLYPNKYVCISYKKGGITNCSLRGKNIKKIILEILEDLKNSSGGGHKDAVGAQIQSTDLEKFKKMLLKKIK